MVSMKYCTNCLMPETRPRVSYDNRGWCNACQWSEEKKSLDWDSRWELIEELCEKYRTPKSFDCIVPVSGGKDSSYVAYTMKHRLKMHPLCVTIRPGLPLPVGEQNVINFINAGYDHIHLTPDPRVMREIDKIGLIEAGRPLLGWQTAVQTAIFRLSTKLSIPLVMFGEDGETEYGGTKKLKHQHYYDAEDSVRIYLEGHNPARYVDRFSAKELYWFTYPSPDEMRGADICIAHWSYFENWDPYDHYLVAKEKCGLQEQEERASGTYNNFAQTDTALYNLHTWLMYLKFGFGRCSQDVGIDIRRGAMSRKQGLSLVRNFDRENPEQFIPMYLDYYGLTREEFDEVIAKHVNKQLFAFEDGRWAPTFQPA
jgi:N-acetyl sugar amidotransferase